MINFSDSEAVEREILDILASQDAVERRKQMFAVQFGQQMNREMAKITPLLEAFGFLDDEEDESEEGDVGSDWGEEWDGSSELIEGQTDTHSGWLTDAESDPAPTVGNFKRLVSEQIALLETLRQVQDKADAYERVFGTLPEPLDETRQTIARVGSRGGWNLMLSVFEWNPEHGVWRRRKEIVPHVRDERMLTFIINLLNRMPTPPQHQSGQYIIGTILPRVIEHFIAKNNHYGDTVFTSGLPGQYRDIARKWQPLATRMTDDSWFDKIHLEPRIGVRPANTPNEPTWELLFDLIGHCLLTLYFLDTLDIQLTKEEVRREDLMPNPRLRSASNPHNRVPTEDS